MSGLQVTVLTKNLNSLNPDYVRILTSEPGFAEPIFSDIQYPDSGWLNHLSKHMTRDEALELYNHYLVWLKVLQSSQTQVILDNNTTPNQPDWIIGQLLIGPSQLDFDLVLYGKYSDLCYLYRQVANIPVSRGGPTYNFGLFKTISPYGGYAYLVSPSGARKLVEMIMSNPKPLSEMVNQLAGMGTVLTYNPSIITLNDSEIRYECSTPGNPQKWTLANFAWYLVLAILLGLILGAFIYFVNLNLTYTPGKEIPVVYTGPEKVVSMTSSGVGSEKIISYGSV